MKAPNTANLAVAPAVKAADLAPQEPDVAPAAAADVPPADVPAAPVPQAPLDAVLNVQADENALVEDEDYFEPGVHVPFADAPTKRPCDFLIHPLEGDKVSVRHIVTNEEIVTTVAGFNKILRG